MVGDGAKHKALLQTLQPWFSLLLADPPTFTLARDGCVDSTVIVALEVELRATKFNRFTNQVTLPFERLRTVREAIDLFYMALLWDPAFVLSGFDGATYDPLVVRALETHGAFELRVTIFAKYIDDPSLITRLHDYFVESLDREMSPSSSFLRAREELEKELALANPKWSERLKTHTVSLDYSISTPYNRFNHADGMELFLSHVMKLAKSTEVECSRRLGNGDTDCHIPLAIDHIKFALEHCPITQRISDIAEQLTNVRQGLLVCQHVRLNLALIKCSDKVATKVFDALSSASDKGLVLHMDEGCDDRESYAQACDDVMHGVANCKILKSVDVGRLLYRGPLSQNARVYRSMLERLLSRSSPCDINFEIGEFAQHEADVLRREYTKWRKAHPKQVLRVNKLSVQPYVASSAFVMAIINVLDDIRELEIHSGAGYVSTDVVPRALTKFRSLRKLTIDQVDLDSMDVFLAERHIPLEELSLSDVRLGDRASFRRFVRALGDSTSPVARTLRSFRIERSGTRDNIFEANAERRNSNFRMNVPETMELAQTLKVNTVLHALTVVVSSPSLCDQLRETHGRSIRFKDRRNNKSSQCAAFLSVINARDNGPSALGRLDVSVVTEVFAYATTMHQRTITVDVQGEEDVPDNGDNGARRPVENEDRGQVLRH